MTQISDLPVGPAPKAVSLPHFPDRLHAYVWRNWMLVPVERLAKVIDATPADLVAIGRSLGLGDPPKITEDQRQRSYITVLRRNWHLLPYEQLIELLGWTVDKLAYALREGDGLFWWFGCHKPNVEPLKYAPPNEAARSRAAEIARVVQESFPHGVTTLGDPLFGFVARLSQAAAVPASRSQPSRRSPADKGGGLFAPRYCFSYFGAFREPLLGEFDPYPEGLLALLAEAGVDGIWLHEPLCALTPFPWDPTFSGRWQARLDALRNLVARAAKYGVGVYLYLNEPRPMPMAFFEKHPELRGVVDKAIMAGQIATLCTSVPAVKDYLRNGVENLCRAVPDLAGIFTITASESYTNCWSHSIGKECPRCGTRTPQEVIAEVNTLIAEGITRASSACRLIVWDWGWNDQWTEGIVRRLPDRAWLMSVSEWSTSITRGGVSNTIGEYSLSVVGPGPRATRHWKLARDRGLKTIAKVQASTTWEIGSMPYVPVVETAAQHAANLRKADVQGLMLSWTLGGYPSPNFEAIMEVGRSRDISIEQAMQTVATRRFGAGAAPAMVRAWRAFSRAFGEYPFCAAVLYNGPQHLGPANPLWPEPVGYKGLTMGFAHPFDDIDNWRGNYPPAVFADQFAKVADGFDVAIEELRTAIRKLPMNEDNALATKSEIDVATACAIHFRSSANQVRFVMARDALATARTAEQVAPLLNMLEGIIRSELDLAVQLHAIQTSDSRIGFEAACQYFYVPTDLAEKVVNCRYLLVHWLPEVRKKCLAS